MNKLFTVTFSSLVALGFGLALMPNANAFTLSPTCQTKAVSSNDQTTLVNDSSETLIAYIECETYWDGSRCCWDTHTGAWACTY